MNSINTGMPVKAGGERVGTGEVLSPKDGAEPKQATTTLTLYHHRSFLSFPIVMAILELDMPVRIHELGRGGGIDAALEELRSEAFSALNPQRTAPILVSSSPKNEKDRVVIIESAAIMLYLVERFDTSHALSPGPNAGWEARSQFIQLMVYAVGDIFHMGVQYNFFNNKDTLAWAQSR